MCIFQKAKNIVTWDFLSPSTHIGKAPPFLMSAQSMPTSEKKDNNTTLHRLGHTFWGCNHETNPELLSVKRRQSTALPSQEALVGWHHQEPHALDCRSASQGQCLLDPGHRRWYCHSSPRRNLVLFLTCSSLSPLVLQTSRQSPRKDFDSLWPGIGINSYNRPEG